MGWMGWTSRPDDEACCEGEHGPVQPVEDLARLLHTRIVEPDYDPLRRSELFPDPKKGFSNTCGNADGASVTRCSSLSDEEIRQRSRVQAARRPNREQRGALLGRAGELRAIEMPDCPNQQLVFIYDDPNASEPLHAVMRGKETLTRPDQDDLRERIRTALSRHVPP